MTILFETGDIKPGIAGKDLHECGGVSDKVDGIAKEYGYDHLLQSDGLVKDPSKLRYSIHLLSPIKLSPIPVPDMLSVNFTVSMRTKSDPHLPINDLMLPRGIGNEYGGNSLIENLREVSE